MNGCEMDRVMIALRDDGADDMATPELATHGVADHFAPPSQNGNRGVLRKQREQPLAACAECARIQCRDFLEPVFRQLAQLTLQSWGGRTRQRGLSLALVYDRLLREAERNVEIVRGTGGVQAQVAVSAALEDLVHEPSAAALRLCAGRCDHQADGGEVVPVGEPHCASENAPDAVNDYDAVACAAQQIPILGPVRPANRDRECVKQV